MSLLEMSFYGGVMILAVTVLRTLTVHRLPKRTFVALWGLSLARLLVPFTLPSAASIYSLLQRHEAELPVQLPTVAAPVTNPGTVGTVTWPTVPTATAPVGTVPNLTAPAPEIPVWILVWLAGVIGCALFFLFVYVKNQREFRASLPAENDFLQGWLEGHPLGRSLQIRQFDRISAPLTYGLFRPVILLPADTDWEDRGTLGYVLEHELVHIRRWDGLYKLVLAAAVCLHWFNPLVWVMFLLANRDLELSCDEAVVRTYGENIRGTYARALIRLEETKSGLTPLYNHFSKSAIEERVVAIMKTRKRSLAAVIAAVLLVVAVAMAFATSAREEPTQGGEPTPGAEFTPGPTETVPAETVPAVENTPEPGDRGAPLDFSQLAKTYHFLSGAGGWQTWLNIDADGTFTGQYEDAEMGSYDLEKYPNGTVYLCSFNGEFGDLEQVDQYIYSTHVKDLSYVPAGRELIIGEDGSVDEEAVQEFTQGELFLWALGAKEGTAWLWGTIGGQKKEGTAIATKEDGTIWAWGSNTYGQLDSMGANSDPQGEGHFWMWGEKKGVVRIYATDTNVKHTLVLNGGTRYITATPYGLEEADEVLIYLPGTPVSSLPEPALSWLQSAPTFWERRELWPETLPVTVLYNVKEEMAFFAGSLTGEE